MPEPMSQLPPIGPRHGLGPGTVPAEHAALARRLRAAEDRLFPLAMVDADRYQRAVRLVGLLGRRLSATCASLDELAAAQDRVRGWLADAAAGAGIPLDGLDPELVVEAGMSQRFRALLNEHAATLRRQKIERARAAGLTWALVEEPDPASWGAGSARWAEAHVLTHALVVRSVVADPATGRPTYRLEVFGAQGSVPRTEEFDDRDAWLAAVEAARKLLESQS